MTVSRRRSNGCIWSGFLLCLVGFGSYFFVFARFPVTRDIPWVNFVLFGTGVAFLLVGLKRAFGRPQQYRGKIAGPTLGLLSLFVMGFFAFQIFYKTRQLPASIEAPRVGQRAPDFVLSDMNDQPVSLSTLLSTPLANSQAQPKGVLLIFYRGYW